MEAIEEIKREGLVAKIYQDEDPESPREWDNLGIMVCFHGRYNLGDKTDLKSSDFNGWGELAEYLEKEKHAKIILPLYLYDHSGLSMKVGSFQGYLPQGHAEFDSGQVGFIYAPEDAIKKEYSVKKISKQTLEKTKKVLFGEVETYTQYLEGDVYFYKVEDEDGENVDSLSGIYGLEYARKEATDAIDAELAERKKDYVPKVIKEVKGAQSAVFSAQNIAAVKKIMAKGKKKEKIGGGKKGWFGQSLRHKIAAFKRRK